jgi:predicted permease
MWARMRSIVGGLFGRRRIERELGDELQFHLRARAEHWEQSGLRPEEAWRRARLEFGAVEGFKERCREARGLRLFNELRADLRFAWRLMRRSPVFTVVAAGTLALAIGANTAIFTLVDAALIKSLPVSNPQDLRSLEWSAPRLRSWYNGESHPNAAGVEVRTSFAYPAYVEMRDRARSFESLVAFAGFGQVNLGVRGRAELGSGLLVSGNFFSGLGLGTTIGRTLTPDDDRPTAAPVVVLSYPFWQRMFGGDPQVLGQAIGVNGTSATIVGVAPPTFSGVRPGRTVDVFAPIETLHTAMYAEPGILTSARKWGFPVIGRLAPGVSDAQAAAEVEGIVRQVVLASPPEGGAYDLPRISLAPGGRGLDSLGRDLSKPLRILLTIVGTVLLIACANITGLLLTQASARRHELSTRLALGAGRGRLARQLMTESLLLAAIGGAIGVGVAFAMRGVLPYALARGGQAVHLDVAPDWRLLLFATGVCALAGLLCGLLPALTASRVALLPTVARGTPAVDTRRRRLWTGKALVIVQVALSLVLVAAAGLFVRTLVNLRGEALGFKPDHLLLFEMDATLSGYKDARLKDFYEAALERVGSTAGVRSASMSRWGLISDSATGDSVRTSGNAYAKPDNRQVNIHYVAPNYFRTMGIALLAGRDVAATDREKAPLVAIVNQELARLSFGGHAIGSRLSFGGDSSGTGIEIVGVAADARFSSLREPVPPTVYIPYRQNNQHVMTMAVRTDLEPTALVETFRRALAELDANVPMYEVRTQEAQIDRALGQERVFAQLVSGFALLALVLACLGIYGTLAWSVARRTPEIGVRMALGAQRRDVVRMVVADIAVPVGAGVVLGLAGALTSTKVLESLLFGLGSRDLTTLAIASSVLLVCAALATWLPSRRASRVDPMTALREE